MYGGVSLPKDVERGDLLKFKKKMVKGLFTVKGALSLSS